MALEKSVGTMKKHSSAKARGPTTLCHKALCYCLPVVFVILIQIVIISEWYSDLETAGPSRLIPGDNDRSAHTARLHHTQIRGGRTDRENGGDFSQIPTVDRPDESLITIHLEELEPRRRMSYLGEMGRGVSLSMSSLTEAQVDKVEEGYTRHGFNEYVSDLISLRRRTPDFRSSVCRRLQYPSDLPSTSVVICFHNEAWSTLLRTVFSVLDNSPTHLIHEIILVDDFSDHKCLGTPLEDYLQQLPKVRLVRASRRLGLIGARLLGTASVTAPVITFLDSHVECLTGWLEPMLSRIHDNDYNVAYPILHFIDYNHFNITEVPAGKRGLFKWMDLSYFPYYTPDDVMKQRRSDADPIPSPTMPGGIFSISRRFFDLLGRYDPGLKTWGSENTELSFKVWMCNGTIEVVPCSGIGHVFRKMNPNLDEDFYNTLTTNAMRVAYVWMDEFKHFFFNNFIEHGRMPDFGDVSERLLLREQLNCRDFAWYMENIAKDLYAPVGAHHIHDINSVKYTHVCLGHSFHKPEVVIDNCETLLRHKKVWYFDQSGQLLGEVLYQNKTWICLSVIDHSLTAERCEVDAVRQQWEYTQDFALLNLFTKQCVTVTDHMTVEMKECESSDSQAWNVNTFPNML